MACAGVRISKSTKAANAQRGVIEDLGLGADHFEQRILQYGASAQNHHLIWCIQARASCCSPLFIRKLQQV
jgi:hypothetical protein